MLKIHKSDYQYIEEICKIKPGKYVENLELLFNATLIEYIKPEEAMRKNPNPCPKKLKLRKTKLLKNNSKKSCSSSTLKCPKTSLSSKRPKTMVSR